MGDIAEYISGGSMKKEFVFRLVLALVIFLLVYQFGAKPLIGDVLFGGINKNKNIESLPGSKSGVYDIIVFGEEPDGIAAAVASARLGARVLLLSQGKDLGGVVEDCLLTNLELPAAPDGTMLNGGILNELTENLGKQFSIIGYKSVMYTFTNNEKNLDIKYECSLEAPLITGHKLTGLDIVTGGKKESISGRMFIDSTRDGVLLEACKVPFFSGSEDINMNDSYQPVVFNFSIKGENSDKIKNLLLNNNDAYSEKMAQYKRLNANARIGSLKIYDQDSGRITIAGLQIVNVDVGDKKKLKVAYDQAVEEAKNLVVYMGSAFEEFSGWEFSTAAPSLYIPEYRHFRGEYQLGVNEVLENTYFNNTIAMGSYPVQAGKFAGGGSYIAGKPTAYSVPLGCIITNEIDNLLMTGSKISYSSLAASSAGTLGTSITTGESAGVVAVFSLMNSTEPWDIETEKDQVMAAELRKYLSKQGLSFQKIEPAEESNNSENLSNWSYPALRELLALGLVAGGYENEYSFDTNATAEDLALILLNGVYRLDRDKYTLNLDMLMRPYFVKDKLTREKTAEILLTMYIGTSQATGDYEAACKKGYINDVIQLRFKDKQVLTMDDVYYLGAYNIKQYTGKTIE